MPGDAGVQLARLTKAQLTVRASSRSADEALHSHIWVAEISIRGFGEAEFGQIGEALARIFAAGPTAAADTGIETRLRAMADTRPIPSYVDRRCGSPNGRTSRI